MKSYSILAFICLFLCSCKQKLQPLTASEAEEVQSVFDKNPSIHPGASFKQIGKQWKDLQKSCFNNTLFDNPIYVGLSNIYGIGSLLGKNGKNSYEVVRDLRKQIPAADYLKFFNPNTPFVSVCDQPKSSNFNFNLAFDALIKNVTDVDLKAEIKNSKKASISAGQWRQLNATTGDLATYIDTSKMPGMDDYRKYLNQDDVYLVTAVLEVSNFSTDIELNDNMSIGLGAKFKGDSMKINVPELNSDILIKKTSAREIKISCSSLFIPLLILSKKR